MKQVQRGFTLIELVMVIVILGVLAAVALPKFVDLSAEARSAAIKGVAGGLSSASAINVAGCAVNGNVAATSKCIPLSAATKKCSDINLQLLNPTVTIDLTTPLPNPTVAGTYYISTDSALTVAGMTCTIVLGNGTATGLPATFTGYATGA